ncbi:MAG TPA: inositol monophosphatase family protein [Tepidisphaeraceae bacterium]|jgi:histidinol phosphatase-like enzyme (inositol monophosphatase family)|nr:inositol monophosphatase family protein [Tepidisphaeraceae bacterium]
MSNPSTKDLLNIAIDAAYLGGRRALSYFRTNIEIETKRDNTPVTIADREAEALIRDYITKYYPTHSILGEEQGATPGDADYRWIIDPIDGTKSFVCGVPLWGVLIGVEVKGEVVAGAVYIAAEDSMISAARGLGCTWNGRTARVSKISSLEDATISCTSPSSAIKRSDAYEKIASRAKLTRGWGDCYGHILVATGRADVMLDPAMNPWDCAPLLPILQEAGGSFTTWSGQPTIWGKDAVSTNGALQKPILEILATEKQR